MHPRVAIARGTAPELKARCAQLVASSNTLRINVCQIAARRRFATHVRFAMHAQMRGNQRRGTLETATATINASRDCVRIRIVVILSDSE